MTETAEKLRSELQALPTTERAEIAFFLIQSLDEAGAGTNEVSLEQDLSRRALEILDGRDQGESAEEVFAQLRAKYPARSGT